MTERPRSSAHVDARRTLRALRVAERPDDVDVDDVEEEEALVVEALLAYEKRLARGGSRAWGGDVGRAVVSSLGGGDRSDHRGSRKRRRRRGGGGGGGGGDLGDASAIRRAVSEATETSDAMDGDGDGDGDDRLWLACVNRALGVGVPNRASFAPEIVEAAADCATAAARSAASSSTDGPARAILAALAPPWLEALCRDDDDDDDEATCATVARLRACTALIETLGVRLSRSTAVLRRVARFARRRAYGDAASEEVERVAARLAAALPLTGNAAVLESEENEKKDRGGRNTVTFPPDEIWTRAMRRVLDSLRDKCRSDRETRLDDDEGDDDDAFVRGSVRVAIALLSARGFGRASVALPIDSLLETARLEISRSNAPRRVALGNALLRATLRRVDARTVGRRAVRAVERSLARAIDVPARVDAIRSLRTLCETLGSSCAIGDGRRGATATIVVKAATSVASDLTTATSGATEGCDEDERERWTIAAVDCLAAYVAAGGGHVAPRARAIIDDAVGSLAASSEGLVSPAVCDAVLRLASACVAAPWRDGAACRDSLVENARRVALRRRRVDSATTARWCDAVVVPRAPPLSIVRARREERGHHHDHHETRWEPRTTTTTTTRSPKARRATKAKTGTETPSPKQQKTTKEPSKKRKTAADTATDDTKDVEKHDDVCSSAPVNVRRDDKKPWPPPCDNEDDNSEETSTKSTPTTPTAAMEQNYYYDDDDDESVDRAATMKKTVTSDHDDNDNEPTSDPDRDAEEDEPTSDPKRTENVAQDDKDDKDEDDKDDDDDDSMASDIPDIVDHDDSE